RHRRRDARRVPASEPVRPGDPGDPSSAVLRRVAGPRSLPPGGVGRVVDDWLRRIDALQRHEDDLAVLGPADESLRHRATRVLSNPVRPDRVAVTRPAPPDERGRGARQQCGRSRDDQRQRGNPRGGRFGGGIRRDVRLRNLLGPEDGPGALTMAVEVNLAAQPQKGHVLAAWGLIGWRWIWRSPAAAIVACILIIWVLYSAIGIAVSSRLRSQREVWPVGNLIFTLLGILSPLYYPLSRLPPVWRELAQLLPATYAALLVQGSLGLEPATATSLAIDAGLLILSTAIGLALAWWLYQWRER